MSRLNRIHFFDNLEFGLRHYPFFTTSVWAGSIWTYFPKFSRSQSKFFSDKKSNWNSLTIERRRNGQLCTRKNTPKKPNLRANQIEPEPEQEKSWKFGGNKGFERKSVWGLADCKRCAAVPGLKPLGLPRDQDSNMSWIFPYGVATISRLLKIIGLFCKRAL